MENADDRTEPRRLVILDDEPFMLDLLTKIAERAGFQAHAFSSAAFFLEDWGRLRPDLILLDLGLGEGDGDGMQILKGLAEAACSVPILIITGFEERVANSAAAYGEASGLNMLPPLRKPFEVDVAVETLREYATTTFSISGGEIRDALAQKQIEVYYQPIIELGTDALVGAKAITCWRRGESNIVPINPFLFSAESSPLISQLVQETTRQAFATLAITDDLSMSVQIPMQILCSENFIEDFALQVRAAGLRSVQIAIEIAEDSAMRDPVTTGNLVTRLRIKGFRVTLDDFGLGYSSLVELQKMPISQINIDQVFVAKIAGDESARTVSRAIIGLGRSLRLQVCADGVADSATAATLTEFGCDHARGPHFAQAMPRADFLEWVRDHKLAFPVRRPDQPVAQFPTRPRRT